MSSKVKIVLAVAIIIIFSTVVIVGCGISDDDMSKTEIAACTVESTDQLDFE